MVQSSPIFALLSHVFTSNVNKHAFSKMSGKDSRPIAATDYH